MLINFIVTIVLALISLLPGVGLKTAELFAAQLIQPLPAHRSHLNQPAVHQWVAQPIKTSEQPLTLAATSVYAQDVDSAKVLYARNADQHRPIASITKLATIMVILQSHSLSETVTVSKLPTYAADDALLGLVPGQQFNLGDLLKAALIPSDNDAADALALYDAGSLSAFTAKMNSLVDQWGIADTHFTSANGLQEEDNYASAASLAKLAKIALASHDFAQIVSTPQAQISDLAGQKYNLTTTNQLLSTGRFTGLKTGYTPAAGESFVGLTTVQGHKVITVVLNSPDRFGESTALADWIDKSYRWE